MEQFTEDSTISLTRVHLVFHGLRPKKTLRENIYTSQMERSRRLKTIAETRIADPLGPWCYIFKRINGTTALLNSVVSAFLNCKVLNHNFCSLLCITKPNRGLNSIEQLISLGGSYVYFGKK